MIKKILLAVAIGFTASASLLPQSHDGELNNRITLRAFKKIKDWSLLGEYEYRTEVESRNYQSLKIGGRYRLLRNLKLGAYFRRTMGERHDDDWIKPDNNWIWDDTNSRGESHLILEATPRMMMSFLPGENWVGEFRINLEQNLYNDNSSLKFRPGLTYFWFNDGEPFINFYTQYELYMPLNYSEVTFYEKWIYVGMLWHTSKEVKLGLSVATRDQAWTNSKEAKSRSLEAYEITGNDIFLGVNLNYYF